MNRDRLDHHIRDLGAEFVRREVAPEVSLYVNGYNTRAVRAYQSFGCDNSFTNSSLGNFARSRFRIGGGVP